MAALAHLEIRSRAARALGALALALGGGFAVGGLALLGSFAIACARPAAPAPADTGRLFFWEIGSDTPGAGRAHLLGSVHLGTSDTEFDPVIDRSFAAAETLVMEVPPEDLDPATAAPFVLARGFFGEDGSLRALLEPDDFTVLSEALGAHGYPVSAVERMKPWLAVVNVITLQFARAGYVAEGGVDQHFLNQASSDKPVIGLESIDSQIAIFDGLPMDLQVEMLEAVLEQDEDATPTLQDLMSAWQRGDLERMEEILFPDLGDDPRLDAFYESMYFQRNRAMSARIAKLVEGGGSYFVVIGAGHMIGAEGIPALLAERGLRLRQLPKTP